MLDVMRRLLCAAVFVASLFGVALAPAGADPIPNRITMSYDFSDNDQAASVSNGPFNIIVNLLPERYVGLVRMIAVAPVDSNASNQVCYFQWVDAGQAECSFNFTDNGVWAIHAQYEVAPKTEIVATAVTKLRVSN